jgi:transposase
LAVLRDAVAKPPVYWGYRNLEWTVSLLVRHLERWDGRHWSDTTIRRQLDWLGYVWKRPRYVLIPDPHRARKISRICKQIKELGPRAALLFEDETDLLLFPPLRACWAKRGRSAEVPLSGRNARRVVFGAIHVGTGHRLLLPRRRQRGEDFRAFLEVLRGHYRGWQVWLLLDEDPSHTAKASVGLAREYEIGLLWLPKRCPELNGMDHLWGDAKDEICANHQESSIDHLVDRFIQYIQGLSAEEALRKAGILSDDFWLKDVWDN